MLADKTVLLALHYLPCIQYFSKLLAYGRVLIEQCENYQKGSYRNRCHLASANGLLVLSIPLVKGKHQRLPVREVRIAYTQAWPLQHWRTIHSAYANAPFFLHYASPLEALFHSRPQHLFDLNRSLLELICRQLDIAAEVSYTTDYQPAAGPDTDDLRTLISPNDPAADPHFTPRPYPQVFAEKHGFLPNLSILDLLFCAGPQAPSILRACIVDG